MLPLAACGIGVYLGLYFGVLILAPVLLLGIAFLGGVTLLGAVAASDALVAWAIGLAFVNLGYMVGLTGRGAYGQIIARFQSEQA